VLAYVQFSTLYYEMMLERNSRSGRWAALDENGERGCWNGVYNRWLPCINAPGFEPYLEKVSASRSPKAASTA
jgi:hypothetical protein